MTDPQTIPAATASAAPDRGSEKGFVFAVTGASYRRLAVLAANSVRTHHPDIAIDVYTDAPIEDGPFDQVHVIDSTSIRPRFHALREHRFDRAVVLDADMLAVAPLGDIFDVLERHDLALAHDQWRNCSPTRVIWQYQPPAAFPQFNGGLVGIRRSDKTLAFVDQWEAGFVDHGINRDQASLRQILWEDREMQVAVLPPEYNFWDVRLLDRMTTRHAAPRLLHSNTLRRPRVMDAPDIDTALEVYLGHARKRRLDQLLAADGTLHGGPAEPRIPRREKIAQMLLGLRDVPRKIRLAMGQRYP